MARHGEVVEDRIKQNVDRTTAFAVLRRLSQLAQEENAREQAKRSWAKGFALGFGLIVALMLAVAVIDPGVLVKLFRAIAGIVR